MKTIFLYVPTKNRAEARRIGTALVKEKLAACVNIVPEIESIYVWNKRLENSREALLLVKTTPALRVRAQRRLEQLHSYDVPCIAEIPAKVLNAAYARWVRGALKR